MPIVGTERGRGEPRARVTTSYPLAKGISARLALPTFVECERGSAPVGGASHLPTWGQSVMRRVSSDRGRGVSR